MATIKANKDKARFVSNTISQDVIDGDWVDHEVITKYKLPEIVIDASTTTTSLESFDVITTGDSLLVYNATDGIVERTAGTVTGGNLISEIYTLTNSNNFAFRTDITGLYDGDLSAATSGIYTVQEPNGAQYITLDIGELKFSNKLSLYSSSTTERIRSCQVEVSEDNISFSAPIILELPNSEGWNDFPLSNILGRYYKITAMTSWAIGNSNAGISEVAIYTTGKYQAPITATTNIPTKAYLNKTIDTTLSAEATGKCKSSTVTQIGVL